MTDLRRAESTPPAMRSAVPTAKPPVRRHAVAKAAGLSVLATAAVAAVVFAAGELSGWRVLAGPGERWLSNQIGRPVHMAHDDDADFRLSLWRGIRLQTAALRVDGPTWAGGAPLLEAEGVALHARWRDVFGWRRGLPFPLTALTADRLRAQLIRRADGSASWQRADGTAAPAPADDDRSLPVSVGIVSAGDGQLRLVDAITQADLTVRFSLHDAGAVAGEAAAPADAGASGALALPPPVAHGLRASATGRYRGLPLRAELRTGALRPLLDRQATPADLPVALALSVGRSTLNFDGAVRDPMDRRDLLGQLKLAGPSLAAVGEPLGITLPTTAAFTLQGTLTRQGAVWSSVVKRARIGQSELDGAFQYDTRRTPRPRLLGRLHARTLALADLGPAIGTATPDAPAQVRAAGRVLPDRRFDLPSLRAMDANVLLRLDRLDFGTSALQAVSPFNGHLTLVNGVLRLADIDARLAQGRISGQVQFDGRGDRAQWQAALDGRGLRLEQWVRAVQSPGRPPYAGGLIGARLRLTGAGRSTAEILGSAEGQVGLQWTQGQISHLVVEAAGLDIAQGLGLLLRGDDPLAVTCGLADLAVQRGVVTPRAFVIDTTDSRAWLTGTVSLADERLALLAKVQPKDFSPLSLRAPLHIDGTLAAPALSLDKSALASKAVPAALLALVHPLAALLPLLDIGEPGPAQGCAALLAEARQPRRDGQ